MVPWKAVVTLTSISLLPFLSFISASISELNLRVLRNLLLSETASESSLDVELFSVSSLGYGD